MDSGNGMKILETVQFVKSIQFILKNIQIFLKTNGGKG